MNTPKEPKSKSDYNFIQVHVRGDRKFVNKLKSAAAAAEMTLADYIRAQLDPSFFVNDGKQTDQNGKR